MKKVPDEILAEFIEGCHRAARHGLIRCSSGNLSRRLDDTLFIATSSRSWMERVVEDDVCLCRIHDGVVLEGPEPTVEIGFHGRILRTRPDINVVMHFQTPCATAMACRESDETDYFVIPEIPFYIGRVARVPYFLPGSEELAQAVTAAMQDHDMVIMGNHGAVTVASDCAHAIQNAEFFELACEIIIRGGDAVKPISEKDAETLLSLRRDAARGV